MSAIKKSISMPDELWARSEDRAQKMGYPTMSAYLQQLVRDDLFKRDAHVRNEVALRETRPPAFSSKNIDPAALAQQIVEAAGVLPLSDSDPLASLKKQLPPATLPPAPATQPKPPANAQSPRVSYRRPNRRKAASKNPT